MAWPGPRASQAVALNNDYSANALSLVGLTLLNTIPVNAFRIGYLIQNQSTAEVYLAYDDGVSSTPSVFVLNPNLSNLGGDIADMTSMPHHGRIRIYGSVSTQRVGAADW